MKAIKKIVVWGTEYKAHYTMLVLEKHGYDIEVVAVGDNNKCKQGTVFHNKKVISALELKEYNVDGIIVASRYYEDIKKQLSQIVQVPIYEDVWELLKFRVSIDITGWCNAKCKWCVTGIRNRQGLCNKGDYMSYEKFKMIYNHLEKINILAKMHEVLLYSWGEPLLNPDYLKIVEYLCGQEQVFSMSTNASVVIYSDKKDLYRKCRTFIFSMPGFSQASYDKIHGFSFENIKDNIQNMYQNIKECGFQGEAILSFHVYKFNEHEVILAKEFAENLGLKFVPVNAYFASYSMAKEYLTGNMETKLLLEAQNDLILEHVATLVKEKPENYTCMVENMLSIDAAGNIELCCCSDVGAENFKWDNILEIESYEMWKDYRKQMLGCATCRECKTLGVDYWFFNNPEYVMNKESV